MAVKKFTRTEEQMDAGEEVKQCVVYINQCDKEVRIAVLGSPGHGKSSTPNTVSAYMCNPPRVKQVARAGFGEGNVTKKFTEHALDIWDPSSGQNVRSKIIVVDTPGKICLDLRLEYEGLEHSHRREEAITAMILQNVIWPLQRAGTTALVVVVSAQQVWKEARRSMTTLQLLKGGPLQIPQDSVIHQTLQILRKILSIGGDRCMRPICIVTHVDQADKAVGRDLRKLPTSSTIKRITAYVARQLGLNPNLVHPVVNLRNEFDPARNMELGRVALKTFCHVLQAAEDGHAERAANPPPPPPPAPPPPAEEPDHIKATTNTELHMLRYSAHSHVFPG